jgi:predicted ATPase/DNA-binding winged helix-turn-helix (wHTH) protein
MLLEGERSLRLGSRALEILKVLVERAGVLVTKEEIVARVWPDTHVEEGNLRVHMAALRRALGDGQGENRYIATVPGRGYCFIAPVAPLDAPAPLGERIAVGDHVQHLPAPLTRMVGRADTVAALAAQLPARRFVTIVGPGGIGKTTVALAVANELAGSYKDGARFIDIAPIGDPLHVPSALAPALGVAIRSDNPVSDLVAFLKDKEMLLLLDSCEHVVEAAAALSEQIYNWAPDVHILVTSREPLRAEGERVQRLLPLGVPATSAKLTAAEALTFPSVQLFVERAAAAFDDFRLTDADAPIVANICSRLDGIPLAIELAAGYVGTFSVAEVAARLDDRFRLLTRGRRTALPRHQTLSATLDWSYQSLSESEQAILRRLAIFAGRFTLDAANAVTAGVDVAVPDVVDRVANLVSKSLVAADIGGKTVSYRLLETTRAYAQGKLVESGELQLFARRHAAYLRDLFRRAEIDWEKRSPAEWLAAYGDQIDNVRAALDWCFSSDGEPEISVALTIVAVPLWLQLSLIDECRGRVEQALATIHSRAGRDPRRDMQLSAALGATLVYTSMGPAGTTALSHALEIAEDLDDVDYKLRALWGLWIDDLNKGSFRSSLALAHRFHGAAASSVDPIDPLMGERMTGISLHFLGNQVEARQHIERMLSRYVTPIHASHIVRFQFDQRVVAHSFHARILWLLGFPDRARSIVDKTIDEALGIGHALSLCNALGQGACPITLLNGDLAAADRYTEMLLEHSARHAIGLWNSWALCFKGVISVRRGDTEEGLRALRAMLDEVPAIRSLPRYLPLLGELALAIGQAGDLSQALTIIDDAIERSEQNHEQWCLPELLRITGELILLHGGPGAQMSAEDHFQKSLDWANRQSTLSWSLRSATSLARLRRDQGRADDACEVLEPICGRFTEGFATADFMAAKELLDQMAPAIGSPPPSPTRAASSPS